MSKKFKNLSDQEKSAIALKAIDGGEDSIQKLAQEYNATEEELKNWIHEYRAETVSDSDEVSLETSDTFAKDVEQGVNADRLNYRRLTFWTAFGTACLVLFIQGLIFMHDVSTNTISQVQSEQSRFYTVEEIKQFDQDKLNSFGVVDPDAGIYRIPIDSAITIIATD